MWLFSSLIYYKIICSDHNKSAQIIPILSVRILHAKLSKAFVKKKTIDWGYMMQYVLCIYLWQSFQKLLSL